MTNNTTTVATLKRTTFGRFELAQYTRTVYSFDTVEVETSGIEIYSNEDNTTLNTYKGQFLEYVVLGTTMGDMFAEAIAAAPVIQVRQW